jgi:hypothetical protein
MARRRMNVQKRKLAKRGGAKPNNTKGLIGTKKFAARALLKKKVAGSNKKDRGLSPTVVAEIFGMSEEEMNRLLGRKPKPEPVESPYYWE